MKQIPKEKESAMTQTMEPRINVITLGVKNLKQARAFYEGMGFRASANSDEQIVFFNANGMVFGLYPVDELAKDAELPPQELPVFRGVTLAYNTRCKEDVTPLLALAESLGGRIVKQAKDAFWGGFSGYFADPDGHLWEVAHNPFWTIDEQGSIRLPEEDA